MLMRKYLDFIFILYVFLEILGLIKYHQSLQILWKNKIAQHKNVSGLIKYKKLMPHYFRNFNESQILSLGLRIEIDIYISNRRLKRKILSFIYLLF